MASRRDMLRQARQPAQNPEPADSPHPLEAAALIVEQFMRGKAPLTVALLERIALCIRSQPRSPGKGER